MKYPLTVNSPGQSGIETRTTQTTNVDTWLERNKTLPENTRVTVRMPSGGTLQYLLTRVRHVASWKLERQTFV